MKNVTMILAILALLLTAVPASADVFPDLELRGDLAPEQAAYLGIEAAPVKVSAIPADFLLVEVFSMYCPICQRDAPAVNELYKELSAADTEGRIRFVGLGAGNTPFEVNFYAKKYEVPFPLFHDQEFEGHKALNNVGTPAYYLVDIASGREIRLFHIGAIEDVSAMVGALLEAAGIKGAE
ncbi:MAG: TlpA family protein disulfide reductase [Desulfovibrionaceae bacterium]|nr:TlpA family protein disulfide reductase [Desulfovibrionaceae bacterium]